MLDFMIYQVTKADGNSLLLLVTWYKLLLKDLLKDQMRFENDWFEEEFDGSFHLSLSLLIAHKH